METTGTSGDSLSLGGRLLWKVTRDDDTAFPGAVSYLGDVNGDGIGDFGVMGSPPALIIFGKSERTDVRSEDVELGMGGFAMSSGSAWPAGDVNGDGLADVLALTGPHIAEERTFVVFGKTDEQLVDLEDVASGRGGFVIVGAGHSVSSGYDVNADGFSDLLVGAASTDPSDKFLVLGKADTAPVVLAEAEAWGGAVRIEGIGHQPRFIGDFDGDGHVDIAVSASSIANEMHSGGVYVIFGRESPQPVALDEIYDGATDAGIMVWGRPASTPGAMDGSFADLTGIPGDVDGDGFADLVVRDYDQWIIVRGGSERESISLAEPGDRVLGGVVQIQQEGPRRDSVVSLGDLDGDGLHDLARTREFPVDTAEVPEGWNRCVDALLGMSAQVESWPSESVHCGPRAGLSLAAGDVTGDGNVELLIADRDMNEVRVYGFFDGEGG